MAKPLGFQALLVSLEKRILKDSPMNQFLITQPDLALVNAGDATLVGVPDISVGIRVISCTQWHPGVPNSVDRATIIEFTMIASKD